MFSDLNSTTLREVVSSSTEYDKYIFVSSLEPGFDLLDGNSSAITEEYTTFILPWWRQMIWTILFAAMVFTSVVGNLLVIWVVLVNRKMRSVTNYLIANLAYADILMSTLNASFNFNYMLYFNWIFGDFFCKFCQFVSVLSISASVFTLMAITIYRYQTLRSPLTTRFGTRATLAIIAIIWAVSSVISVPNFMYYTTEVNIFPDETVKYVCFGEWPDGTTTQSQLEYIYNVLFMVLMYFVPVVSMTYTYTRVCTQLWGSQSSKKCLALNVENVQNKRRVVKMMIVIVITFAICWLPFHLYFLITSYFPEVTNYSYIKEIYLSIYWLAMSNAMVNPIIFFWLNPKFRRFLKKSLTNSGVFCCKNNDNDLGHDRTAKLMNSSWTSSDSFISVDEP